MINMSNDNLSHNQTDIGSTPRAITTRRRRTPIQHTFIDEENKEGEDPNFRNQLIEEIMEEDPRDVTVPETRVIRLAPRAAPDLSSNLDAEVSSRSVSVPA